MVQYIWRCVRVEVGHSYPRSWSLLFLPCRLEGQVFILFGSFTSLFRVIVSYLKQGTCVHYLYSPVGRELGGGLYNYLCKSISFSKSRSKLLSVGGIEIKLSPLIFGKSGSFQSMP